jgi:multidrug efflux pump subunit AcrB
MEENNKDLGKAIETSIDTDEGGTLSREQWNKRERAMATQITELRNQIAKIADENAAKEKAELEQQQKWKELAEKTRQELEQYKSESEKSKAAFDAERLSMRIDAQLKDAGVQIEELRDGIRSRYLATENRPEIDAFITDLKQKRPELFVAPRGANSVGVKASAVGTINQYSTLTDDQIEQMLKSTDPQVRNAAHRENLMRAGLDPGRYGV